MANYVDIFLRKIGQIDSNDPMDIVDVMEFLDDSAFLASRNYATPWADFDSVPEKYKYPIVIFAALDYWWAMAGSYTTKFDMQAGNQQAQKSGERFNRAMTMITSLQKELEDEDLLSEGSGDIIVGDLITRSKFTGRLVPNSDDIRGDWLS